jgi:tetratricopeptide (TPR) repeat protein
MTKHLQTCALIVLAAAAAMALSACDKKKKKTKTPNEVDTSSLQAPGEGETKGEEEGLTATGEYDLGESDQKATFDEPAPELEDVGKKSKEKGDKITQEGVALLAAGNTSGAKAKFKEALDVDPKAHAAAYNLGVMAEMDGEFTQAKKYYKQAFTAQPDYGPAVAAYVMLEYKTSGSKSEALSFIEPKAKKYPDVAEIQAAYAKLLVDNGQIEKAMTAAKEALKKDERSVPAMVALAKAYHKNGQNEFAKYIAGQAKDIDPDNADVYVVLSYIALADNNKKLAVDHLKKAVELSPNLIEARNNLAVLLLDGANFEEAAAHLEKIVPLASYKAEIFLNLGEAYRGMKKWKEAIDAFAQAEKLGAPKSMIYFDLALLYFSADVIAGMSKKEAYQKSQSFFIKYRDAVGAKTASQEIDVDSYLKRLDKMIKIQEKLEAKKKGGGEGEGG